MFFGRSFRQVTKFLAPAAAALMISGASFSAQATSVLHEGTILSPLSIGGVGFSSLHKSTNGRGGGRNRGGVSGDVAYTWDVISNTDPNVPTSFAEGTTATFDVEDLKIYDRVFGWNRFELTLLKSATSVLTVGEALDPTVNLGGRTIAHTIGGALDFRLDQYNAHTGRLIASAEDTFVFDDALLMGVVNGVAETGPSAVEIFLWGDTGSRYSYDCVVGNCWKIKKTFYAHKGLGIDLAFTGNGPISTVPVPAALPLLLSGFGALAFVARRRRNHTAK